MSSWLLLVALVLTAPTPPQAQSEILALMDAVETSGCEFERNGKRYEGDRARSHLERKRRYLGDRIQSAEDFILMAATESSRSGDPYAIICADTRFASAQWLRDRLKVIRADEELAASGPKP